MREGERGAVYSGLLVPLGPSLPLAPLSRRHSALHYLRRMHVCASGTVRIEDMSVYIVEIAEEFVDDCTFARGDEVVTGQ